VRGSGPSHVTAGSSSHRHTGSNLVAVLGEQREVATAPTERTHARRSRGTAFALLAPNASACHSVDATCLVAAAAGLGVCRPEPGSSDSDGDGRESLVSRRSGAPRQRSSSTGICPSRFARSCSSPRRCPIRPHRARRRRRTRLPRTARRRSLTRLSSPFRAVSTRGSNGRPDRFVRVLRGLQRCARWMTPSKSITRAEKRRWLGGFQPMDKETDRAVVSPGSPDV